MISKEFSEYYLQQIGLHTPLPLEYRHQLHHANKAEHRRETPTEVILPAVNVENIHPIAPVTTQPHAELEKIESLIEEVVSKPSLAKIHIPDGSSLQHIQQMVADCNACALAGIRTQTVFGSGNADADLVFIGESPDSDEDREGEVFVGKAGQLLNKMIEAIGFSRNQVYLMNSVHCKSPWDRKPSNDELQQCRPFLDAQLHLLNPNVICLLGQTVAQSLLQCDDPLNQMRGKRFDYQGIPVRVSYHPADLLRSPANKQHAWKDLLEVYQQLHINKV